MTDDALKRAVVEIERLRAERDALRELLRQARYSVQYELRARIDAALKDCREN